MVRHNEGMSLLLLLVNLQKQTTGLQTGFDLHLMRGKRMSRTCWLSAGVSSARGVGRVMRGTRGSLRGTAKSMTAGVAKLLGRGARSMGRGAGRVISANRMVKGASGVRGTCRVVWGAARVTEGGG